MLSALVKAAFRSAGLEIRRAQTGASPNFPPDFTSADIQIVDRTKDYTYTSPERIAALCNATRYVVGNAIEGAFVECGVWRGGSMMAAMLTLIENKDADRECFLYDTYEGMSEPTDIDINIDGITAMSKWRDAHSKNERFTYASLEDVKRNVGSTGYPEAHVHYVVGKVEDTIPGTAPSSIAMLRLDTDWYESTKHEMHHLFPRIVKGGVIIIDDYGHWVGARKAVDEYLAENRIRLLLNRIDYTGRIGVK